MDAWIFAWLQTFDLGITWTSRYEDYADGEDVACILEYIDREFFPQPTANVVETNILKLEQYLHDVGRPIIHRVSAQAFRNGDADEIAKFFEMILVMMVTREDDTALANEHIFSLSDEYQKGLMRVIETHLAVIFKDTKRPEESVQAEEFVELVAFEQAMRKYAVKLVGDKAAEWERRRFPTQFNDKIKKKLKKADGATLVDDMQEEVEKEKRKRIETQKELDQQISTAQDQLDEIKDLRLDVMNLKEKLSAAEAHLLEAKRGHLQKASSGAEEASGRLEQAEEQARLYQEEAVNLEADFQKERIKLQGKDAEITALKKQLETEIKLKEESLMLVHELQAEGREQCLPDDATSLFDDMKIQEAELMDSRGEVSAKRVGELEFLLEESKRAREMWQEKYAQAERRIDAMKSVMQDTGDGDRLIKLEEKLDEAHRAKDDMVQQLMTTINELANVKGKLRGKDESDSVGTEYDKLRLKSATKIKEEREALRAKYDQVVNFLNEQLEERDRALRELVDSVKVKEDKLRYREEVMSRAFHALGLRLQKVLLKYNALLEERDRGQ